MCLGLQSLFVRQKAWFELPRVNLIYRNILKGNKNYPKLSGGLSYRGFELLRVKL